MIKARCINKPESYWGLTEESVYDVVEATETHVTKIEEYNVKTIRMRSRFEIFEEDNIMKRR